MTCMDMEEDGWGGDVSRSSEGNERVSSKLFYAFVALDPMRTKRLLHCKHDRWTDALSFVQIPFHRYFAFSPLAKERAFPSRAVIYAMPPSPPLPRHAYAPWRRRIHIPSQSPPSTTSPPPSSSLLSPRRISSTKRISANRPIERVSRMPVDSGSCRPRTDRRGAAWRIPWSTTTTTTMLPPSPRSRS